LVVLGNGQIGGVVFLGVVFLGVVFLFHSESIPQCRDFRRVLYAGHARTLLP
jgi:hypothetical protein